MVTVSRSGVDVPLAAGGGGGGGTPGAGLAAWVGRRPRLSQVTKEAAAIAPAARERPLNSNTVAAPAATPRASGQKRVNHATPSDPRATKARSSLGARKYARSTVASAHMTKLVSPVRPIPGHDRPAVDGSKAVQPPTASALRRLRSDQIPNRAISPKAMATATPTSLA